MAEVGDVLPELTRTLRAFGSRRGVSGQRPAAREQQSRFFEPLVTARRAAAAARSGADLLDAFDPARLRERFRATLSAFAVELYPDYPAASRAVDARLSEAAEPLMRSIDALAESHAAAAGAVQDDGLRAWATSVQAVFDAADKVWMAVDPVLEHATTTRFTQPAASHAYRGRRRGG